MTIEEFDFVVVGGGSAGAVVASRLAAASASVLLLEAGGSDRKLDVRFPAGVSVAYEKRNWKYPTEPDPTRNGQPEAWMAGKVMGGGGSINSCVFVRGNKADYDGWAKQGCDGWDYDSVLPSFKRLESWEGGASDVRGGSGPISVGEQTNRAPANLAYIEAAKQAGHESTPDYNGERQDGVGMVQVNHRRGMRSQASHEYLKRVAPRDKITVRTRALASKVIFEGRRAIGVEYDHDGSTRVVHATQEVIVSGGTIGSPKLLMLSGVGPRDQLAAHGIDVVADVPGVGQNLHEHPYLMQRWRATLPTLNKPRPGMILKGIKDYALHGTGLFALTMVQVQVMHRSDPTQPSPDLQLQFVPLAITRDVDENGMFNVQLAKEPGFLSASTFLRPRARGRVSLRSASPTDPPRIDYQFFADTDDLRDSVKGLRAVQEIMAQPAMSEITDGQLEPERSCRTEADWEDYVRKTVTPSYHPVGTCKMGVDDRSVVDPQLRVRGTDGLRVVDASIMPTITSGNTNAPSMMIGERAAELILSR